MYTVKNATCVIPLFRSACNAHSKVKTLVAAVIATGGNF